MSHVSSSLCQPSHATPCGRIFKAYVYISTLQLIAGLLLTLMLLWHISTITLVENYQMPDWWVKAFLAEHANGWRVGVWVVVVLMVPIDGLHALLCLDWWCFMLHGREGGDEKEENRGGGETFGGDNKTLERISVHGDICHQSRKNHDLKAHACTASQLSSHTSSSSATKVGLSPSGQPPTYHLLLHQRLSPQAQSILLSIFDIVMLAILAGHIVTYFKSLSTTIAFCNVPAVLSAPDLEFGADKVPLSMQGRCIGLNVDIHVAGGFAVFMAIVLGLLHIAVLAVRVWEYIRLGKDGVARKASLEEGPMVKGGSMDDTASRTFEAIDLATRSSSMLSSTPSNKSSVSSNSAAPNTMPRDPASVSAEERSTGVRFVDWSVERAEQAARRRAALTGSSETSRGSSKWGEMLLECVTDA